MLLYFSNMFSSHSNRVNSMESQIGNVNLLWLNVNVYFDGLKSEKRNINEWFWCCFEHSTSEITICSLFGVEDFRWRIGIAQSPCVCVALAYLLVQNSLSKFIFDATMSMMLPAEFYGRSGKHIHFHTGVREKYSRSRYIMKHKLMNFIQDLKKWMHTFSSLFGRIK